VFGYLLSFKFDKYSGLSLTSEILGFSRREFEAPPILLFLPRVVL